MELLYLARSIRKRPRYSYKLRNRTNYSWLLKVRHLSIGTTVACALVCAIASGVLLARALTLQNASATLQTQITHMEETYRREHDELEPVRADSHEMKLAVDTGDYILRNSLPVEWVMSQVGRVMGDHNDMHIDRLDWSIESPAGDSQNTTPSRPGERDRPIPIPQIAAVNASITGEIRPYDGNLYHAFEKIDRLAKSFEQRTDFERVIVTQYPIDASPGSAVSGEVRRSGDAPAAEFSLVLTLRVDHESR